MLILEIYGRVCRVCMCKSSNLHDLNDTTEDRLTMNEMLTKTVSGILANIEFPVPQEICDLCMEHLQISFRFQQLCLNTNKQMFNIWEQSLKAEQTERYIKLLGQTEDDKPDPIKVEYDVEIDKLEGEEEKPENIDVLEDYDKLDNDNELTRHRRSAIKNYNESEEEDVPLSALKKKKSENPTDEKEDGEASDDADLDLNKKKIKYSKIQTTDKNISYNCAKFTKNRCGNDEDDSHLDKGDISDKSFTTPNMLQKHLSGKHKDIAKTSEIKTKTPTKSHSSDSGNCRSDMTKHAATHTNAKLHVCDICGNIFARAFTLRRHKLLHSEGRSFKCFTTPNMLQKHLSGKHKDIAKTSEIKTKSPTKSHKSKTNKSKENIDNDGGEGDEMEMDNHVNNSDSTEDDSDSDFADDKDKTTTKTKTEAASNQYHCNECDASFKFEYHLARHMNKHTEDHRFVCDLCWDRFRHPHNLISHIEKHHPLEDSNPKVVETKPENLEKKNNSPSLCPLCGNIFRNARTLRHHMERHKGLKQYQCPECPSRFNTKSDMIKHAVTHTNAKRHVCDICGKSLTRAFNLRKHKLFHSEERPFKCDQCSMTFKDIYHLRRHMRTHTGEKPYKCKYCERAYSASGDLTKHLRTHVGKNTYICDQCPMAFKYQIELKQHQAEHYKMAQKLLPTIIEQKEPQPVMDDTARQDNNIDIENLTS